MYLADICTLWAPSSFLACFCSVPVANKLHNSLALISPDIFGFWRWYWLLPWVELVLWELPPLRGADSTWMGRQNPAWPSGLPETADSAMKRTTSELGMPSLPTGAVTWPHTCHFIKAWAYRSWDQRQNALVPLWTGSGRWSLHGWNRHCRAFTVEGYKMLETSTSTNLLRVMCSHLVAGAIAPNGRTQYTVDLIQPRGCRHHLFLCLSVRSRITKKFAYWSIIIKCLWMGSLWFRVTEFIRFKKWSRIYCVMDINGRTCHHRMLEIVQHIIDWCDKKKCNWVKQLWHSHVC